MLEAIAWGSGLYLFVGILSHSFWHIEFDELDYGPISFTDRLHEVFLWPAGWYYFIKAAL